jgi:hypothetical protein
VETADGEVEIVNGSVEIVTGRAIRVHRLAITGVDISFIVAILTSLLMRRMYPPEP